MRSARPHSKRGFSLLEVMIVMALAASFGVATGFLLRNVQTASKNAREGMVASTDEVITSQQVFMDLRQAGASFNYLTPERCTDATASSFFDLLPDTSCAGTKEQCGREAVLDLDKIIEKTGRSEFTMATVPTGYAQAMPISPIPFYDSVLSTDFNESGTLTFNPSKFYTTLKGLSTSPSLMKEGTILRFYSPITQRQPATSSNYAQGLLAEMQKPPRAVVISGVVRKSGSAIRCNGAAAGGLCLDTGPFDWMPCSTHPLLGVDFNESAGLLPVDKFFRMLPPVGGKGAFAMVTPLQIVRYRLEAVDLNGKTTGQLLREVYGSTGWEKTTIVMTGVRGISFKRNTISAPLVTSQVTMDRL